METAERRIEILKTLCRRRYEKTQNLALEFGVSERTIRRDIEILSLNNPIYTQSGKYAGGVYILDGYTMERMYMSQKESDVLLKVYNAIKDQEILSFEEKKIFNSIISIYTKPLFKKGKENEKRRNNFI